MISNFYTVDKLRKLKSEYAASVSRTLSGASRVRSSLNKECIRVTLRSGRNVISFVDPAHAVSFNNEELNSERETDVVAKFFKEVHDWIDFEEVAGPAERVKLEYELSRLLDELKRSGLLVFGERKYRTYECDLGQVELLVSFLNVMKERD